ncbi:hypothetical protein U732_1665 [Clostridium argentinense CDC 2741]|uniref:Uncharacterized protein n=1 Tax=Clostridium argentinense CDC 2741 TaxID=1418104 RepID=A0A0C1UFS9_9CLOT|nr:MULTISPECIES: hypothetical protein [Clostridium]ARC84982.1 hypothetical protein RSJ17_10875 [Clostridium argentinense]KIE46265.1 hypothetical protein U732_1665 [Clostridium argentinense CDC 2741]NFF40495.1 hypothetical protein [Clostridium argentinense]NFP50569.1 hypothetical protein [Clostridium argentinense]NFP72825.1 hypothetical protein [Clostridium argentinense]
MELSTREVIKLKLVDLQENVRDFQSYADKVDDKNVKDEFKALAKECGYQAQRLQGLLGEFED